MTDGHESVGSAGRILLEGTPRPLDCDARKHPMASAVIKTTGSEATSGVEMISIAWLTLHSHLFKVSGRRGTKFTNAFQFKRAVVKLHDNQYVLFPPFFPTFPPPQPPSIHLTQQPPGRKCDVGQVLRGCTLHGSHKKNTHFRGEDVEEQ